MKKELMNRIRQGISAENAQKYIKPLLENYKENILAQLYKGEDEYILRGKMVVIKQIEEDIKRDISHAEDAKKHMQKYSI